MCQASITLLIVSIKLKCLNINNSSIHFAILAKQIENMVKLIFGLLFVSFVLIKSTGSYYIGKIPTSSIIILCLYKYQQEENPIEDKEFTDCCKLKHSMTQL